MLDRIEGKLDKQMEKIETLMSFMATSNERVIHCRQYFTDNDIEHTKLSADIAWVRGKILVFMGAIAVIVWALDRLVKI